MGKCGRQIWQNLRDHMSEAELIFTALAELSTRQIAETDEAKGVKENAVAEMSDKPQISCPYRPVGKSSFICKRKRENYEINQNKPTMTLKPTMTPETERQPVTAIHPWWSMKGAKLN